jgi:hypothetical protein
MVSSLMLPHGNLGHLTDCQLGERPRTFGILKLTKLLSLASHEHRDKNGNWKLGDILP